MKDESRVEAMAGKLWKAEAVGQAVTEVHLNLSKAGWAMTTGDQLGMSRDRIAPFWRQAAEQDPRGPQKRHSRDVISYQRTGSDILTAEEPSIAHTTEAGQVVDDFARYWMLSGWWGRRVASTFLRLVPPSDAWGAGYASADYFVYSPGVVVGPHQDKFGRYVMIWCTARSEDAEGGVSTLQGPRGEVLRAWLKPDDILIFDDSKFVHGMTELEAGIREALIMIELRKGQS